MAEEGIKSIDELRRAQAAAQEQGTSITNYSQWAEILEDFDIAGIQSTGTYAGDVKLHEKIIEQMQELAQEVQETQKQQQMQPTHKEEDKLNSQTASDKEQVVKSNVANATSSVIMADYMKYYHLLS